MILKHPSISCWCILHLAMYRTGQTTKRMWSVDLLARLAGEGVGMAMTPIEPEMRTIHETAAAPLRSGETGLGWRSGISRVLCISPLLVDLL